MKWGRAVGIYFIVNFSDAEPKLFIFGSGSTLFFISAPAPAPATAIYCNLKLFYNSSNIPMEVEISFSSSS